MPIGALGMAGIGAGINLFSNLLTGDINQRRQLEQQEEFMRMQRQNDMQMSEYNFQKQLELWEKTGYGPQMEQMKKAGLNPALMYKGAGPGGSTAAATVAGSAPKADGNYVQAPNLAMGMELALLKAQKDNIEADTATKQATKDNLEANTEGKGIENAFNSYMMSTDEQGNEQTNIHKSIRGQQEAQNVGRTRVETQFKLDENERQALMNSKVMEEIGAKISLMHKQGLTQEQIYKNLQKEGDLLDAEIEWNKLDINSGNVGKFISNIIKMLFRPR